MYLSLELTYVKTFLANIPSGNVKHNYKHCNVGCIQ